MCSLSSKIGFRLSTFGESLVFEVFQRYNIGSAQRLHGVFHDQRPVRIADFFQLIDFPRRTMQMCDHNDLYLRIQLEHFLQSHRIHVPSFIARCRDAVPHERATAYLTPTFSATCHSTSLIFAPTADIQFVSNASVMYVSSKKFPYALYISHLVLSQIFSHYRHFTYYNHSPNFRHSFATIVSFSDIFQSYIFLQLSAEPSNPRFF